jgi:hypothetical protein
MLRLEWEDREGRDDGKVAKVFSDSVLFVWGGGEEPFRTWLNWNQLPPKVDKRLKEGSTLLEAQQAAETALKDALKPYAELYARLGGEI